MSETPVPPTAPAEPSGDAKTVGILSYCTLIGFIIAIILNSKQKSEFGAFHLQQALGLIVCSIVASIALSICGVILAFIPIIGPIVAMLMFPLFGLGCLALVVIGIINAVNGKMSPLPVVGGISKKFFGKAFL